MENNPHITIISHIPEQTIKRSPVWMQYACILGFFACFWAIVFTFKNITPAQFLLLYIPMGAMLFGGLLLGEQDKPEEYTIRRHETMPAWMWESIQKKWHINERADGTYTLIHKFPEEEDDNV